MSYEKQGFNTNNPWGNPLYSPTKKDKSHRTTNSAFQVIFDDEKDDRHPLYRVSSGLPGSLGDAMGDLNPDAVSNTLLSVIYGMRVLKATSSTARKLLSSIKDKVKTFWADTQEALVPGAEDNLSEKEKEIVVELMKWKPLNTSSVKFSIEEQDRKDRLALKHMVNRFVRAFLDDVENLLEPQHVRLLDKDVKFINQLSGLGISDESVAQIRCLPSEKFIKFKNLVAYQIQEEPLSKNPPWKPVGYQPLGAIYTNQKLGSFEAEPDIKGFTGAAPKIDETKK